MNCMAILSPLMTNLHANCAEQFVIERTKRNLGNLNLGSETWLHQSKIQNLSKAEQSKSIELSSESQNLSKTEHSEIN